MKERGNYFLKIQQEYISQCPEKRISQDTHQLRIEKEEIYQNTEGKVEKHIHLLNKEKRR